ncbi:hypothetical protein AUC47_10260 [Microbacterium sp. SZ1]|uniref:hypothetical protein n=1 Tax=Microbacterium sp. SZ1 TaxID=1849736 RepID=UPI000BBB7BF5|nr:hypothetical protein [Microbacterium sp. SZ1]PCE15900.1 hypothetical protein AUC47_10260 [Microbacterium sp. SZ1]
MTRRNPFDAGIPKSFPFVGAARRPPRTLRDSSGFLPASAEVAWLTQITGSADTADGEVIIAELIDDGEVSA